MKTLLASLILTFSFLAQADTVTDMLSFFSSTVGVWSGEGVGSQAGRQYRIEADLTVTRHNANAFIFDSVITNARGTPVPTQANYEIENQNLLVTTAGFSAYADIDFVSPNSLSFVLEHTNAAGNRILTSRQMTLRSANVLEVVSSVYNNGTLIQTFNYTLTR